uniref:Phosphoinositide phospholipase C n=1 Tax=Macrostomum lignano TaxID=282301 RepID=A0A1I8F8U7_9PLAT
VYVDRSGELLSLKQIFEAMKITDYDLNIDMLDFTPIGTLSKRFDKFNSKYNPLGRNHLREVFLKTDNHIGAGSSAEILREVMNDLKESRYQNAELLAVNLRFPACSMCTVVHASWTFPDILDNLFRRWFEATIDPSSHPHLFVFMQSVVAFDSVDDESKSEFRVFDHDSPGTGRMDGESAQPADALLPVLPTERGLQPIVLRPHCARLDLCIIWQPPSCWTDNISHGMLLRSWWATSFPDLQLLCQPPRSSVAAPSQLVPHCSSAMIFPRYNFTPSRPQPVLQYLYYLAQVPMAMSPLSNNSLFLPYSAVPCQTFHAKALCVTLSTDDPLMFHIHQGAADGRVLYRGSGVASSPTQTCASWPGTLSVGSARPINTKGVLGTIFVYTNLPNVRVAFRFENLLHELALVTPANPRFESSQRAQRLVVPAAMSTRTKSMSVLFEDEG